MSRPTNDIIQSRESIALRLVSAFGVENLDNLQDYDRTHQLQAFAAAFREETGVSYFTSRHYIAFACRRLRGQIVATQEQARAQAAGEGEA